MNTHEPMQKFTTPDVAAMTRPGAVTRFFMAVVPSYRLAPAHVHPAQAEDVAAALAWTVKNITNTAATLRAFSWAATPPEGIWWP